MGRRNENRIKWSWKKKGGDGKGKGYQKVKNCLHAGEKEGEKTQGHQVHFLERGQSVRGVVLTWTSRLDSQQPSDDELTPLQTTTQEWWCGIQDIGNQGTYPGY